MKVLDLDSEKSTILVGLYLSAELISEAVASGEFKRTDENELAEAHSKITAQFTKKCKEYDVDLSKAIVECKQIIETKKGK